MWWAAASPDVPEATYSYGPYHVPLVLEQIAGVVCAVLGLLGAARVAVALTRRQQHGLRLGSAACLLVAVAVLVGFWRAMTAGTVGANVGAGVAALEGPLIITALLGTAARLEYLGRDTAHRHHRALTAAAIVTAPALFALVFSLT